MEWIVEAEDLNDLLNGRFTAETKPLCRCNDCKWFDIERHQCDNQICAEFYENDYCSYGERRTDG